MGCGRRDKGECFAASLSPQRGLQGPTHGEGQLCLVLVGIKSIMPEEVNFSSLSCILFAWLDSSHVPGPQGMDSKSDREREPDRTLPRDAGFYVGVAGGRDTRAACWVSGPGGTHGQEGRGKAECQALGRGALATPSHVSFSPHVTREAMDCSCISLMNTLGLLLFSCRSGWCEE